MKISIVSYYPFILLQITGKKTYRFNQTQMVMIIFPGTLEVKALEFARFTKHRTLLY